MATIKNKPMKLVKIQAELKAPKNQMNAFGKYKYRSAEDIIEAVKPILFKNNCALLISDEIVQVADRVYVKATAMLIDESNEDLPIKVYGWAREEEVKKAYRKLASIHHPDKGGDPEMMTRLNNARDLLLQPEMSDIVAP